jgi:hypothetical protein
MTDDVRHTINVALYVDADPDVTREAIVEALPSVLEAITVLKGTSRWNRETNQSDVAGSAMIDSAEALP